MLDNTIQIVVSYDRIHVKRRRVGWGHHNITLPRAPQGDKTALLLGHLKFFAAICEPKLMKLCFVFCFTERDDKL